MIGEAPDLFSSTPRRGIFLILALDEKRGHLGDDIEEKRHADDRDERGQGARPSGEVGEQLLACFVVALLAGVSVGVALPAESPLGIPVYGALFGAEEVGVADGGKGERGKIEALGEFPPVVGARPRVASETDSASLIGTHSG